MQRNDPSPAVRCTAPKNCACSCALALVVVRVGAVNGEAKKGHSKVPFLTAPGFKPDQKA